MASVADPERLSGPALPAEIDMANATWVKPRRSQKARVAAMPPVIAIAVPCGSAAGLPAATRP